jgi:hypothetical protein
VYTCDIIAIVATIRAFSDENMDPALRSCEATQGRRAFPGLAPELRIVLLGTGMAMA